MLLKQGKMSETFLLNLCIVAN